MSQIANLRIFSSTDLLHLLNTCSDLLIDAYQDTLSTAFSDASFEAMLACEYLKCEIEQSHPDYRVH